MQKKNNKENSVEDIKTKSPHLLIVMGVSGCGKTTLAKALAEIYGYTCLDADDFHSEENKAHMASGQPLSDAMRLPWVHSIREYLQIQASKGISCTLAFSGLRRNHREILRQTPMCIRYIFLKGTKEIIAARMQARNNHFMPTSLLDSQFSSLEDPSGEADVMTVDITPPIDEILANIQEKLQSLN